MANEKRLIYADDALAAEFTIEEDGAIGYVVDSEVIRRLPTVDAVPVVRCKDCKYFYYDTANEPSCESLCGMVVPNEKGFCSYGEREDND